jgi:Tol biopolymer transport system component
MKNAILVILLVFLLTVPTFAQDNQEELPRLGVVASPEGYLSIYEVNWEDGSLIPMIGDIDLGYPARPAISPDGRFLVFGSSHENQHMIEGDYRVGSSSDIYVLDMETGDLWRMTENEDSDTYPTWSPDGQQLMYVTYDGSEVGDYDIKAMGVDCLYTDDGCATMPVSGWLVENDIWDSIPQWLPDGKTILFSSDRVVNETSQKRAILMDIVSGEMQQALPDFPGGHIASALAPNGKQFIISYTDGDVWQIGVIPVNGSEMRFVDDSPYQQNIPFWSPDGQWIAYQVRIENVTYAKMVHIDNGDPFFIIEEAATFPFFFPPEQEDEE